MLKPGFNRVCRFQGRSFARKPCRFPVLFVTIGLLTLIGLLSAPGKAQSNTSGGLSGSVIDIQSDVVPGALVKLRAQATGIEHTAQTDLAGDFHFPSLAPGIYSLETQAPGFSTWRASTLVVEVSRLTQLTAQLRASGLQQASVSKAIQIPSPDPAPPAVAIATHIPAMDRTSPTIAAGTPMLEHTSPRPTTPVLAKDRTSPSIAPSAPSVDNAGASIAFRIPALDLTSPAITATIPALDQTAIPPNTTAFERTLTVSTGKIPAAEQISPSIAAGTPAVEAARAFTAAGTPAADAAIASRAGKIPALDPTQPAITATIPALDQTATRANAAAFERTSPVFAGDIPAVERIYPQIAASGPPLQQTPPATVTMTPAPDRPAILTNTPALDQTAMVANIDVIALDSLPINGRRWSNFALQPKASPPDESEDDPLSFRGISVLPTDNALDGADGSQAFFSGEREGAPEGDAPSQPSQSPVQELSSVQEFKVNSSNYTAEEALAAGSAAVNTVARPKSTRMHGEAFIFDRDNILGATNPFTTLTQHQADGTFKTTSYRPTDVRKQWGIGAGGPILPGKMFWYLAYDQHLRVFPGVARASNAMRLFAAPSATALATLALRTSTTVDVAATNYQTILNGLDSMLGSVARSAHEVTILPKLDWQINDHNHIALQYKYMRGHSPNGVQTAASNTFGIGSFGDDLGKEDLAIARWDLFLSANLLNEARFQYGHNLESEISKPPAGFEKRFANNVYGRSAQISLASGSGFTFGKPSFLDRVAYPDERREQFVDTVTLVRGNHVLKVGYDINNVRDYTNSLYNGTGTYTYSNVLNFASDYFAPSHCSAGGSSEGTLPCYSHFSQSLGTTVFQFSTVDYALFLSDEWKLRHGLSLSIGARYEYEQLPRNLPSLINPDIPETSSMPHDGNNYGPRLGFAWDIGGKGKTVLRAGYGMYFGRIMNSTVFAALTGTGTAAAQRKYYFRPVDPGSPAFPDVLSWQQPASIKPSATYFDERFQNPQIHQFELSLGQEVGHSTQITAGFLMSLGRQLPNYVDTNVDLTSHQTIQYVVTDSTGKGPLQDTNYSSPFFTTRLNPNYKFITKMFSETTSRYEAGMIKINHRMGRTLDLRASYAYSHSSDFNQNESTFADNNDVLDPTNLRLEYGTSDFDVRSRFTGSAVLRTHWKAPGLWGTLFGGYTLAPVAEVRTGMPYTMRTTGSIPSIKYLDLSGSVQTLSGLGENVNGSGGDNRIGIVGRNTYRYPGVMSMDARASKRTALNDHVNLDIIAEIFNVLNHQNVTRTNTTGYYIGGATTVGGAARLTYNPDFGQVTDSNSSTRYRERQIQLAVKLVF